MDSLSAEDRLTLDVAQSIREDFLQQNAFVDVDAYTPLEKQYEMLSLIFLYEERAREAIGAGVAVEDICALSIHERIGRAKTVSNDTYRVEFAAIAEEIKAQIDALVASVGEEI